MLNFRLDPPSGYTNSYLDIKFIVKFDSVEKTEIRLFNESMQTPIEILTVSQGHINKETTVVLHNVSSVEGYINLFNRDKMNTGLQNFVSIDIRCEVTSYRADVPEIETAVATFYNQSKSIDANITPFDLVIVNRNVDLKSNIPLQLHFVCGREKRYELCIKSEDDKNKYIFEVFTRNGQTDIEIPSEILWSDLDIQKSFHKKFDIYWVKFESITYMKTMGRTYVPIDNSTITFNDREMMPQPQNRLGPTNMNLSKDFVLSHRYFVHTWKDFSSFGNTRDSFGQQRLNRLTRFYHESQNMQSVERTLKKQPKQDSSREIRKSIVQDEVTSSNKQVISFSAEKQKFLSSLSKIYMKRSVESRSKSLPHENKKLNRMLPNPQSNGCGCSRKNS